MIKDWVWCWYTPGAAGKLLCALMQISQKVHEWDHRIKTNLPQFIKDKIIVDPTDHLKYEINFPYDLFWYTRQLPFTRGDDLTTSQAQALYDAKNKSYNKLLTMIWCKPYLPKWFDGRCINIVNDNDSLNFLRKRRDAIFYKWEDDKVFFKRFIPETCGSNTEVANRFKDHPTQSKRYKNKNDFYYDEFYNHAEVKGLQSCPPDNRVSLSINLSDVWKISGDIIADRINESLSLDIDRKKAKLLVDAWLENNSRFI